MDLAPSHGKLGRLTTDDYLFIDVNRFKREGLLKSPSWFSWQWTQRGKVLDSISVTVKVDRIVINGQDILIEWWGCPLGGKRPWLHCPSCGKRCCHLYKANRSFACKTCLNLIWKVWHERPKRRAQRRAEKAFRKCKFDFDRKGHKPKWQRWQTFERLEVDGEKAANLINSPEDKLLKKLQILK